MPLLKIDPRFIPPKGNAMYADTCCIPCDEPVCTDIRTGEFAFTAPNKVFMECEPEPCTTVEPGKAGRTFFPRTFRIVREVSACVYEPIASISKDTPAQICCEGDFVIKYEWDACCETEPRFVTAEPCGCM